MLTKETEFTIEELAESASINYQSFMLGSIAFLEERGLGLEDWSHFLAERFASYWPEFASAFDAIQMARITGLILVAGGGKLTLVEGDTHSSRVIVEDYLEKERLERFGVSLEQLDVMLKIIFGKIAAELNWQMHYHRTANHFEFRYWR